MAWWRPERYITYLFQATVKRVIKRRAKDGGKHAAKLPAAAKLWVEEIGEEDTDGTGGVFEFLTFSKVRVAIGYFIG